MWCDDITWCIFAHICCTWKIVGFSGYYWVCLVFGYILQSQNPRGPVRIRLHVIKVIWEHTPLWWRFSWSHARGRYSLWETFPLEEKLDFSIHHPLVNHLLHHKLFGLLHLLFGFAGLFLTHNYLKQHIRFTLIHTARISYAVFHRIIQFSFVANIWLMCRPNSTEHRY